MRDLTEYLKQKLGDPYQTKINNSNVNMSVVVSRAKNSVIDTTYWITETIRIGSGLGDVALTGRRMKASGSPDGIYEIHVDNGVVKTAYRPYPDLLKNGWQDISMLENGSSVSIAFDGYWEKFRKNKWRLITGELPYLFWVNDLGELKVQVWEDVGSRLTLGSGVVKVRALRGWRSLVDDADMGIVVAYIKMDGLVYYRSYCKQLDGSFLWEVERQLTLFTGSAVSLNLAITIDYRMMFIVETNTGSVEWFVTQRSWGGYASPMDYLKTGVKNIMFDVYPIDYIDGYANDEVITSSIVPWFNVAEPIYPVPVSAENDDEYTIRLKFNHPLDVDLSSVASAFTMKDSTNVVFGIISTSAGIDNSEIVFNMSNFNSSAQTMNIIYDRSVLELDAVNQGSRFAVESFTFGFDPVLIPPEGNDFEYLSVSLPITFTPKFVYYRTANNGSENVSAGITGISFVVTKVGSNPL